eukprot:NODE_22_length_38364_cov_0.248661.p13 type:complete len:330 gc:universal NODE_22_length_38364_cov_0.248661:4439-5428(+)
MSKYQKNKKSSLFIYLFGLLFLVILLLINSLYLSKKISNSPRLAFAILVHNKDTVEGAIELMDVLYPSKHCFIIHFDKNTPKGSVQEFLKLYPFAIVAPQHNVEWGKFSMIEAELDLLKESSKCVFDHLLFLDGKSFPLKSLKEIENQFLKIPKESSIVFSNKASYGTDIPTCRRNSPTFHACARTSSRCLNEDCTKYKNTPNNAPIYKGPQWTVLSSSFINHLLSHEAWLLSWKNFFARTVMPDESFFQTVLMDSPFSPKKQILEQDWLQTVWKDCRTYSTQRSKRGFSPCTLGLNDYGPHLKDSKSIFIRKISAGDPLKSTIMHNLS